MASLPSPVAVTDWSAVITAEAVKQMNAVVSIYNPGDRDEMTPVLLHRRARIQHIRRPVQVTSADQWSTNRDFVFQIDLFDDDPLILKGYVVRVEDGGKDPALTNFAFTVLNAVNSSHAALRTIQTVSELTPVEAVA